MYRTAILSGFIFCQIAYISTHTREFCFKVGRDLLASICVEHPFVISLLLQKVYQTLDQVGMVCVTELCHLIVV